MAVLSVKDVANETKEFMQVQRILRQNTCGDDPEDHLVNCCGPDQKPNKIDSFNEGKGFSDFQKCGWIIFLPILREVRSAT